MDLWRNTYFNLNLKIYIIFYKFFIKCSLNKYNNINEYKKTYFFIFQCRLKKKKIHNKLKTYKDNQKHICLK